MSKSKTPNLFASPTLRKPEMPAEISQNLSIFTLHQATRFLTSGFSMIITAFNPDKSKIN